MPWWTAPSERSWNDEKAFGHQKLLILNLPYILLGLFATNFGEAWRMAQGADASAKNALVLLHAVGGAGQLVAQPAPAGFAGGRLRRRWASAGGVPERQNAKKYRHNVEYGSARWGKPEDIAPYVDPVFQNNVILTKTESLTMNSRPKDPKTAQKQKCAGHRRQRLRQDPLLVEAEPDADAQLLCGHRPERHDSGGVR